MYKLYKAGTKPTASGCVASCYSTTHLEGTISRTLKECRQELDVYKDSHYRYTIAPNNGRRGYNTTYLDKGDVC